MEGQNALINKQSIVLSPQNLVDCSEENEGCGGGWLHYAMDYIEEFGIESDEDYPYIGTEKVCQYNASKVVLKIKSYMNITPSEDFLLFAVGK